MGISPVQHSFRRGELESVVLTTVAAAGLLAVAVVAPNALQLLNLTHRRQKKSPMAPYRISRVVSRLLSKGYLQSRAKGGHRYFEVTPLGKQFMNEQSLRLAARHGKKIWDGKWRFLVFDIPETRRAVRDRLRYELYAAGFRQMQQSVWVSPYRCDELVALLKTDLNIWKNAVYMVSSSVENESQLLRIFKKT